MGEVGAAHAMLGFDVADAGLDGGAATRVPLDRFGDAPLFARDIDLELMGGRRVVATIAVVGDDAGDVGVLALRA